MNVNVHDDIHVCVDSGIGDLDLRVQATVSGTAGETSTVAPDGHATIDDLLKHSAVNGCVAIRRTSAGLGH